MTRPAEYEHPYRNWENFRSRLSQDEDQVIRHRRRVLSQLRRYQDLTQRVVAEEMGISQSRVSKIESGDMESTEVGTLAKYVSALGGTLKLVVQFGDQELRIE